MFSQSRLQSRLNSQAGVSLIELLFATGIFVVSSLSILGLITASIGTNNRNKVDSTQTMLAGAIIEQVTSTLIGSGESTLSDCAGTSNLIKTTPGGAPLDGDEVDFTEAAVQYYSMEYVVNAPCTSSGVRQAVYDVRWNVSVVGTTNTYMITVGAKSLDVDESNPVFAPPVHFRLMAGN